MGVSMYLSMIMNVRQAAPIGKWGERNSLVHTKGSPVRFGPAINLKRSMRDAKADRLWAQRSLDDVNIPLQQAAALVFSAASADDWTLKTTLKQETFHIEVTYSSKIARIEIYSCPFSKIIFHFIELPSILFV